MADMVFNFMFQQRSSSSDVNNVSLRYQYDPNGRVRDAMAHIWAALVPEPKVALDAHFGDISDELLKEMGGRMWRSREAACLALADLIQVSKY